MHIANSVRASNDLGVSLFQSWCAQAWGEISILLDGVGGTVGSQGNLGHYIIG